MQRLKKRRDYLKVARGARTPRRGFLLQSVIRGEDETAEEPCRFGFTVTKKIGNAVVRNRIRRRLKEAVRLNGAALAPAGRDMVLVGRRPALDMPFADLVGEVTGAIKAAARDRRSGHRAPDGGSPDRHSPDKHSPENRARDTRKTATAQAKAPSEEDIGQ